MATKQFTAEELKALAQIGISPGSVPGLGGNLTSQGNLGGGLGGLLQLGQLAELQRSLDPDTTPIPKTFGLGNPLQPTSAGGFAPGGPVLNFTGGLPEKRDFGPAKLNNFLALATRLAQQRRQGQQGGGGLTQLLRQRLGALGQQQQQLPAGAPQQQAPVPIFPQGPPPPPRTRRA